MSRTWSVLEMIRWTTGYFTDKGIDEPRLNAELLLAGALGIRRLDLYLQFDRPLTADEIAAYKPRLIRRARGEPLQYIAGETEFRELTLKVDARVLIPRPETELLVGRVLDWSKGREGPVRALDIGTGSGAIALSLATEGGFALVATDVSEDALRVAAENHAALCPSADVAFMVGAGYAPVRGERFDVIVSNPPYIGESERDEVERQVAEWEPARALFAGGDGLDVIREIVAGAPGHLRAGGLLALEIGARQAGPVSELIRATAAFREPIIIKDLAGHDRIVLAELSQEA